METKQRVLEFVRWNNHSELFFVLEEKGEKLDLLKLGTGMVFRDVPRSECEEVSFEEQQSLVMNYGVYNGWKTVEEGDKKEEIPPMDPFPGAYVATPRTGPVRLHHEIGWDRFGAHRMDETFVIVNRSEIRRLPKVRIKALFSEYEAKMPLLPVSAEYWEKNLLGTKKFQKDSTPIFPSVYKGAILPTVHRHNWYRLGMVLVEDFYVGEGGLRATVRQIVRGEDGTFSLGIWSDVPVFSSDGKFCFFQWPDPLCLRSVENDETIKMAVLLLYLPTPPQPQEKVQTHNNLLGSSATAPVSKRAARRAKN